MTLLHRCGFALLIAGSPLGAQGIPYVVQDVVPGVFAIIRRPSPASGSDSNVLVIENERDVVVVDANILPTSARENIAIIKRRIGKPVSHVINTHWHSDHHYGNHEYRKAYPRVEFVQHANTRADIIARDMPALEQNIKVEYPQVIARLRRALATGRTSRGDSVTPAMRSDFTVSLDLYETFLKDMAATPLVPGTIVVHDSLIIRRERRSIVVKYLGRGNTAGDLVVHLPEEKIVATGDLVVHPAPFAFSSHLREWPETLRRLKQIDARHIMPGHGEMMSSWEYTDALISAIESVWTQVNDAVARGLTLDSTRKVVDIDAHRGRFSGATRQMLDGAFLLPGIEAAYTELTKSAATPAAGSSSSEASVSPLPTLASLEVHNARADTITYRGRRAIRLAPAYPPGGSADTLHSVAVIKGLSFANGTIELDVAGSPLPGAGDFARGFIGVGFHVQPDGRRFKAFFIRPTNGRSDDQLRRNHSTQYIAEPEFPWHRLRREEPGRYESYVDLVSGEWTRLKVVVRDGRAELFVNGAVQPALVVSDMKLPLSRGGIALWIGTGTDGYFSNLRVQ